MRTFITLLFLSFSVQAAQVSSESAILRSGPSADTSIVEKMVRGDELKVVEKRGDWYLTETEQNHVGWIQASVIKGDDLKAFDAASSTSDTTSSAAPSASTDIKAQENSAKNEKTELTAQDGDTPSTVKTHPPVSAQDQLLTREEYTNDFHELSIAIRPGLAKIQSGPTGMDKSGFILGGHLSYFLKRYVAISVPYTYTRYSNQASFQSVGGGPLVRFLDWGPLRGSFDANALYVRGLNRNHFGWSLGGDLTAGFKKATFKPFIGPFIRYDKTYITPKDIGSLSYGIGITLTEFAELD